MKAIKRTTLVLVCISALYLAVSALLSFTDTAFRAWAQMLGQLITGIATPIMILVLALVLLNGNEHVCQAVKTICTIAAVIVCGIYICFAMFFILLGSQDERRLTRHLLVTDDSFLSETNPVYYRPTAFFFKRRTQITGADQEEYLEEKYHRPFGILEQDGFEDIVYDWEFPEIQVSVWLSGMSLADNYVEELTLSELLEVYRSVDMERGYHIVEVNGCAYLCLEASGYDDIPALSEDIVCLMAGVMSGGFSRSGDAAKIYQEYKGTVYFSFGKEEGYTGSVPFGGKNGEWPIDVEAVVRTAYRKYGDDGTVSNQEPYANTGESSVEKTIPESAREPEMEPEPEPDYREEAAKAVYDAALSGEGFSYEVCYNAKGNLYIDLGSKKSEENGKTYVYSLVYDRPSKNGACELLVLYRSVKGSDHETIVDMYAVETATGKVVVSGKKAWSDVGTKEYREMTGE